MTGIARRRILLGILLGAGTGAASTAHAIVGRPFTPLSGAGVARRSTRRVVRRTSIYATSLPSGCVPVTINGGQLYQCGATYYQPYQGQYTVVEVQ